MKYIQTTKAARSPSYRGSVSAVHKDFDTDLQAIYSDIRRHNAEVRKTSRKYGRMVGKLRRVCLMGRGPRAEAAKAERRNPRAFDSIYQQILRYHLMSMCKKQQMLTTS